MKQKTLPQYRKQIDGAAKQLNTLLTELYAAGHQAEVVVRFTNEHPQGAEPHVNIEVRP